MKKREEFKEVHSFAFINEELYFMQNNDLFSYSNSVITKIASFKKQMQELYSVNSKLFINDIYGAGYLIEEGQVKYFNEFILTIIQDKKLLSIQGQTTILKEISSGQNLLEITGRSVFSISENEILYRRVNQNRIEALRLTDGELLWELDISTSLFLAEQSKPEINKFIGILDNLLFVSVTNSHIVSIDITTGMHKHHFHRLDGFSVGANFKGILPNATSFELDKKRKVLFSVFDKYYIEINLLTGLLSFKSLAVSMAKFDLHFFKNSFSYAYNDQHVYTIGFMDRQKLKSDFNFMALTSIDRILLEVDSNYVFTESHINSGTPKLCGNRLYQLDAGKVLHVFEID